MKEGEEGLEPPVNWYKDTLLKIRLFKIINNLKLVTVLRANRSFSYERYIDV